MRRYGLIGRHLSHSFSAKYFAEKFLAEGLRGECEYNLYELPTIDHLPKLLASTREMCGFNVTIPYKQEIIPFLDRLSDEARAVGAVNCVKVASDGSLVGYNTDIDGVRYSLDKLLGSAHVESALVLGSGGASLAVKYVLRERGIDCLTVSRSSGDDRILYSEVGPEVIARNTLIINASPVGMYPHVDAAPDIPYFLLTPSHFLFDLVYNPTTTEFLRRGALQGTKGLSGIDMLYAQADKAWEIWNER